jgi:spore germination protein GerM
VTVAAALAAAAIVALGVGTLVVGSQGCKPAPGPVAQNPSPTPTPSDAVIDSPPRETGEPSPGAPTRSVWVYKVKDNGPDNPPKLQQEKVELTGDDAKSPATAVLKAMVGSPDSPLPKDTTVRSLKIDPDGTATVDFSEEFQKNFTGGDNNEAVVLNAVTAALGQFSTVKQVQILVDGKKIDSLGGNMDLTEPIMVPQLASDGTPKTASAEGGGGGQ